MGARMIPANFHSLKSRSKTDMELLLAIKQGVLFSPMHGWEVGYRSGKCWMYDALSAHWLPLIPSTKFARPLKGGSLP
jgi:hypothetical protein